MRPETPSKISRRQALAGATLTFGALWGSLSAPGAAAAQGVLAWTPKALTADQARVLDVVAELIVPATDTPGAREAGVPAFVDRAIATFCAPADAGALKAGLSRIDADARAAHGAGFTTLTTARQMAMLAVYEAETRAPSAPAAVGRGDTETGLSNRTAAAPKGPPFFALLKELVTVGYFTSQLGATRAVRYDPVPGDYRGCVPLKQIGRAWAT